MRRFVHVSTRAVSEAGGAYSLSKRLAERAVTEAPVEHTIVRLSEMYGGAGAEGIDRIVSRARRGAAIPVVGDGADRLCPMHVDDAVAALVGAVAAPAASGRTYTLGGECLTTREFAEACARAFSSESRLRPVPVTAVAALGLLGRECCRCRSTRISSRGSGPRSRRSRPRRSGSSAFAPVRSPRAWRACSDGGPLRERHARRRGPPLVVPRPPPDRAGRRGEPVAPEAASDPRRGLRKRPEPRGAVRLWKRGGSRALFARRRGGACPWRGRGGSGRYRHDALRRLLLRPDHLPRRARAHRGRPRRCSSCGAWPARGESC